MSWGTSVNVIPPRQENEVLREIRFHTELDASNNPTDRVSGQFRHRDGRIWSARILPLEPDARRPAFRRQAFLLALTSGGCRQYTFISRRLQNAKSTVLRFSNLPLPVYERLTADAKGTSTHPRSGEVAVFRLHVIKRATSGHFVARSELTRYDVDGIGRYEQDKLVVFPDSAELAAILDQCCADDDVRSLVPEGINSLPAEATMTRIDLTTAQRHLDSRVIDMDHIHAIVGDHFYDSVDDAIAGLHNGSYHVREERRIDLRDEDESTDPC